MPLLTSESFSTISVDLGLRTLGGDAMYVREPVGVAPDVADALSERNTTVLPFMNSSQQACVDLPSGRFLDTLLAHQN